MSLSLNLNLSASKPSTKKQYNSLWRYTLQEPQLQSQNPVQVAESDPPVDVKRLLLDFAETILLAVILYFGINAVSARVRVDGYSMNPSLENGEYIL